jgi:iron complex outermembrane receptor protein
MAIKYTSRPAAGRFMFSGVSVFALLASGCIGTLAASAADEKDAIEEIIVTAQHRAQTEKDVAETVSVLSGANLDEFSAGGADITFLNARVPSLYASSSYGRTYPVFSIRGFGDNDFDYNAQQPVSVVYDNVVLLNPILKAFPVFDTVGLEVAKGPQGTLYGTNTPGGVIKIDSVRPSDKFEGYADVSWGTYNTVSANGAVGGPIIPGILSMRISLLEEYRDNWVTNDYTPNTRAPKVNGYDDTAGRIQLLYTPNEKLSMLLNVHARNMDGTSTLFRGNALTPGTNDLVPGFKPNHIAFDDLYTQKLETKGASLDIDYDLGPVKLTSITGWESGRILSRGDLDGGWINYSTGAGTVLFDSASQDVIPNLQQYTQEFRLAGDITPNLFNQGGVYVFHDLYQDMTYEYDDNMNAAGMVLDNPLGELLNTRQSAVSWGIFDSATYKFDDKLSINAGIRESHDYKDLVIERYFAQGGEAFLQGSTPDDIHNTGYHKNVAGVGASSISWDLSLNYKVTDDLSAYFRAARGGKGPAIEARDTFANNISTAKQESTTSYEGGIKSTFLDKRAKLNLDGYIWDDRDAQITSTGGASNLILLQNAKNVEGYGIEMEGELKPISHLLLTGSFSYNHTEIQDPNLYTTYCGNGCTVTSPLVMVNGQLLASLDHAPLQNAPEWIAAWTLRYDLPLDASSGLYLFTDWTYRGNVLTTAYKSVESTVQPLLLGGLRIGYENFEHDYEISAFSRNILNRVQAVGVAIDFVPGDYNAYINDPRTFGVQFKKRF